MHNVIVGTGPAAAAAILALADDPSQQITVVDIGERLADDTAAAVDRMSALEPAQWATADRELVSVGPAEVAGARLPEKRAYGSNHMFIDRGQQRGLAMPDRGNHAAVSGALGGFSTVWGAQIMPFSRATFNRWPFGWDDIEPHYRAMLAEVPLAGEHDDYAEDFPLLSARGPLPPVSARTAAVLDRYQRHRDAVRAKGVVVGKARLAFAPKSCLRCGLCMTGCPYSLIYSARQTVDRFVRRGRVRHISRVLVTGVEQPVGETPTVRGIDLATDRAINLDADRVFLGAGGLGSTRIALNSLNAPPYQVPLQESVQFLVPFVSRRTTGDPRGQQDFTLNQFNLLLKYDDEAYTTSQVHCYPYNPAIAEALPSWLPPSWNGAVLGRLTAGLGYLPSWRSPQMRVDLGARHRDALPDITIRVVSNRRPPMLASVLRRLTALGPKLDLFPVLPMVRMSGPGKSYHFGSTFPHGNGSDLLGRIGRVPQRPSHRRLGVAVGAVDHIHSDGDGERSPHRVGEPACLTWATEPSRSLVRMDTSAARCALPSPPSGYRVVALQRSAPAPGADTDYVPYSLEDGLAARCLTTWPRSSTAPTTCAPATAPRSNESTSAALRSSFSAVGDVPIVLISSMSAYSGTQQIYGRTKIACEDLVAAHGGTSLRLGLVYGEGDGGMIGALRKVAGLPLVPMLRPDSYQYAIHAEDMARCVVASVEQAPPHRVARAWPTRAGCRSARSSAHCARPQRRNRFVPCR